MKFVLPILFFLAAAVNVFAALGSTVNGNVRLSWNYNDEPANTNLAFNLYITTDLTVPFGQWPQLTNILSTAALDTNDASGTSYFINVTLPPAHYFFVATMTNFWGESSITSNVVSTPPAPQPINTLKIQKSP